MVRFVAYSFSARDLTPLEGVMLEKIREAADRVYAKYEAGAEIMANAEGQALPRRMGARGPRYGRSTV